MSAMLMKIVLKTEAVIKKLMVRMTTLRTTTRALARKTRERLGPFPRASSSLWIKSEAPRAEKNSGPIIATGALPTARQRLFA